MPKQTLLIAGIQIELERKHIKNVNFTIYPPDGRVRVSAPKHMKDEDLYEIIRSKIPWINRHRERIIHQERPGPLTYLSGERHAFLGKLYTLKVYEHDGRSKVSFGQDDTILMWMRHGSSIKQRERLLIEWYRRQLKMRIPAIIARWEPVLGVKVAGWGVKRMKTRWGSCNTEAHRIWLNLELIKHPEEVLEYIVVHEMVHLLERRHNKRFYSYMDQFLPEWRVQRYALKTMPIGVSARTDT
jgi:predicted metal-dependent hydrolase